MNPTAEDEVSLHNPTPTEESVSHLIDTYAEGVLKSILRKLNLYLESAERIPIFQVSPLADFTAGEQLFIKKYGTSRKVSLDIEPSSECTISDGDTSMKVDLGVYKKMKYRKLINEADVVPPTTESELKQVVAPGKNAYEIRLELIKESIAIAHARGCSAVEDEALRIANKLYTFVENKRR